MKMDEVVARINVLARKAKNEGLTEEETAERAALRRIYIDSVKANLVGQLDNTYILQPDGTKKKIQRKYCPVPDRKIRDFLLPFPLHLWYNGKNHRFRR